MIKDKIEYLGQTKEEIKNAIESKGVDVVDTDTFRSYADKIREIPSVFEASDLPEQTLLLIKPKNNPPQVELNWRDVGAYGYKVLKKENSQPITSTDGIVLYDGTDNSFIDTDVEPDKLYFYRVYPYNSEHYYQSNVGQSVASAKIIDRTNQVTIGELSLGDEIAFGRYNGTNYTWKIVDTQDDGYVTVWSQQSPQNVFDAAENATGNKNPVQARETQGNNRWLYSNARQFLNSDGAANEWFIPQHEYDVKPPYYNKNGFLFDFTDYEKSIIVNKTNMCLLDDADGGGSETMIDKMWLASSYAVALDVNSKPFEDDHPYEYFYLNAPVTSTTNWFLRTINGRTTGSSVRDVNSGGALNNISASSNYALRPFCLLPTSAYVAWSDSDNAYVFADDSQRP